MKKAKASRTALLTAAVAAGFFGIGVLMGRLAHARSAGGLAAHLYAALVSGMLVQVMLHEAGHLAAGLLTGYRFLSYRVGSVMLQRVGGAWRLRRFSLPGTGGQCLMAPPEPFRDGLPTQWYNYGGVLANLLTGLAFAGLALFLPGAARLYMALYGAIGFAFALLNGVPLQAGLLNDGAHARALRRSGAARFAFFVQLCAVGRQQEGQRLKDMPDEWFVCPDVADDLTLAHAFLCAQRLMDEGAYGEALALAERLYAQSERYAPLLRFQIACDLAYLYATDGRRQKAEALMDKTYLAFQRKLKRLPPVRRTALTMALGAAGQAREEAAFQKALRRSSYPGEEGMEKGFVERAKGILCP